MQLGRRPAANPAGGSRQLARRTTTVIEIDTRLRQLRFTTGRQPPLIFRVAVGKPATPTPTGRWRIQLRTVNPGGVLGSRWLGLNVPTGNYGIHGTNAPWSIGQSVSNGCIRMHNRDIESIYNQCPVGTPVWINQPPYQAWPSRPGDSAGEEDEPDRIPGEYDDDAPVDDDQDWIPGEPDEPGETDDDDGWVPGEPDEPGEPDDDDGWVPGEPDEPDETDDDDGWVRATPDGSWVPADPPTPGRPAGPAHRGVTLRQGDRGQLVEVLQQRLRRLGLYEGHIDGIYGPLTEQAVHRYQEQEGLSPDGVAGPTILNRLGM